jgi:glucan phosphoethanolaminetransferase (alkaline phosphatase superfamily)
MAQQPSKGTSKAHEFFRKRMVTLKRKPQTIPLLVLVFAFIYYSFNLSSIANTTALINGPHMGLAEFCTMLFSALSLVCFLNSFPHRKKANIPMVILTFVMLAALIYADYYYGNRVLIALTREESPISPTGKNAFVAVAQNVVHVHMGLLIAGGVLLALLPVYGKLLRKINTNIDVADNGGMQAIDISGEDA